MRKVLSIAVSLFVIIASVLAHMGAAYAAGGPVFMVGSNVPAIKGSTVTVPISVSNNPGFVTTALLVEYDPAVLTLTSVVKAVEDMNIKQFTPSSTPGTQRILLAYEPDGPVVDWTGSGTVVNVNFSVLPNAPTGTSPIGLSFASSPSGIPANAVPELLTDASTISGSMYAGRGLISITPPTPIRDVPNGTAKNALGLPDTVTIVTTGGDEPVSVGWDLGSVNYDPTSKAAHTFTVTGTIQLPNDVINPNNVSLSVPIEVSVDGAGYGDLDGYGEVNTVDLVHLMKCFAEEDYLDSLSNPAGADVNGDGTVDMLDLVLLMRYFAENGVILGSR